MSRWPRLAVVAGVTGLLVAGRGRLARLVRTIDQRAGIFAPRGAGLYSAVAPTLLRPLYRQAAEDVAESPAVAPVP